MQKCLDTLHDAVLTTRGMVAKGGSPPGGCPWNSSDTRGLTAEQGTDRQ
jgi:hypothetical protein